MAQATIKVEFNEQSKAIVANTKIELIEDNENNLNLRDLKELALTIGKELFNEAHAYAKAKTLAEK